MKITRLDLENYGPFQGKHTFEMTNRGLVLVLGENLDEPRMNSNGSGKSSLFDALDWVLFGEVPKGDHVDSIIHDGDNIVRVVAVIVDEDQGGRPLMVERVKERGKSTRLQFWVGANPTDAPKAALDLEETQRLLELELGLDRDVFHATVFYGQLDAFHFAEATEVRRMELLSRILPELASIDGWGEVTKVKAKALEEARATLDMNVASAQARISELQNSAADLEAKRVRWEQEREARLLAKQNRGQEVSQAVEGHKQRLGGMEAAQKALADVEASLTRPQADVTGIDAQIQTEQRGLQGWVAQESNLKGQLQVVQAALGKIRGQQAGKCSQCGQAVTAEHLAREVATLQAEFNNLGMPLGEIQGRIKAAQANLAQLQAQRVAEVSRADALYREQQGKVAELRRAVDAYSQIRAAVTAEERELGILRQDWMRIKEEANPFGSAATDNVIKIKGLQGTIEQTQAALATNALNRRYVEFWVDAFANKGLKSYILDNRLGEMSDAANHWVKLLTGGTIWVRFETQKLGRTTKRLSNDINIRVFRYNPNGTITERNYKSWSGGEKRRVSWAIDFGLSRLVAARARKRWDALVLDEVFKHVDAKGGEAVVEMLQYLRRERSSIFVVEHDAAFQSHFEQRVVVRKQHGSSVIMENTNEKAAQGIQGDRQPEAAGSASEPPRKKKSPGKVRRRGVSSRTSPGSSEGGGADNGATGG